MRPQKKLFCKKHSVIVERSAIVSVRYQSSSGFPPLISPENDAAMAGVVFAATKQISCRSISGAVDQAAVPHHTTGAFWVFFFDVIFFSVHFCFVFSPVHSDIRRQKHEDCRDWTEPVRSECLQGFTEQRPWNCWRFHRSGWREGKSWSFG